jgi:hypothetical protein
MSEPNLKAMSQEELLKYLEEDFMPKVLNKLAENARLKAEVERLEEYRQLLREADSYLHKVEAQVERLTLAGDAFYESEIGYYGEQILNDPKHHTGQLCRDWNAAKEGKGQP